jgi:3-oxoadipate enol-lactonase
MEYARVGDLNMCYEVRGKGHPLALISGMATNIDWWEPVFIDALAQRYRVLVFDNRGAGRTQAPEEGGFSCEQMARDTCGLLEELGMEPAYVLGHSMGGMIALELALNHQSKVDKLVLCATYPGGRHNVLASEEVYALMADIGGTAEELHERRLPLLFTDEWMETNPVALADFKERCLRAPISLTNSVRQFVATTKLRTYDRLPDIKVPTLVATGNRDIQIRPENSSTIAGRVPGAKLIVYDGAAHQFFMEKRDAFTTDLIAFLG